MMRTSTIPSLPSTRHTFPTDLIHKGSRKGAFFCAQKKKPSCEGFVLYSIEICFFVSMALASVFLRFSVRTPESKLALISSGASSSPT